MPWKVPSLADLQKDFTIEEVPGFDELDEPIHVSFRQATDKDDTSLEQWVNDEPITFEYQQGATSPTRQRIHSKPDRLRRAYECYLTMADCDIVDQNDKPLIHFAEANGYRRVAGSFDKFQQRWGMLPGAVTRVIHLKCQEANPDWSYFWASRVRSDEGDDEDF